MHCPDFATCVWCNLKMRPFPVSMSYIDESTPSPCVRNCCLGDDLNCLGCFRSLEEIKEWGLAHDGRRREILRNAEQRRAAYQLTSDER